MKLFSMKAISMKAMVGATAIGLVFLQTSIAIAGGFAIREQSTSGLGAAFAGNAAGYDLSSIFWNPAAVSIAGTGFTSESHFAVIIPDVTVDPDDDLPVLALPPLGLFDDGAVDIGKDAVLPASYAALRLTDALTIGYGFNAPFGLGTEPDNRDYAGLFDARKSVLKTYNFNPVVGYQLMPTLALGVGLQVMYAELKLKSAVPVGMTTPSRNLQGDDWTVGYTLGALWQPMPGTSVGMGYRSQMKQTLEGDSTVDGVPGSYQSVRADGFNLPDVFTISLRQNIASDMRLLGTFEWTNWSILQKVTVFDSNSGAVVTSFEPQWDDSYFYSGGFEFDYSDQLTLRTGVAYEKSPIQNPEQRLLSIPDTDRIWVSVGATYKWTEQTSFDFAYTHIFGDDARISSVSGFRGGVEADVDIIAFSFKSKWGADGPFGLLKGLIN